MSKPKRPLSVLHPETVPLVSPRSLLQAHEYFVDEKRPITLVCQRCGKDREVRSGTVFTNKPVNPLCLSCVQTLNARKRVIPTLDQSRPDLAKLFAKSSPVQPNEVGISSRQEVVVVCQQCGREHVVRVECLRSRRNPSLCATCKPYNDKGAPQPKKSNAPSLAEAYPHLVPLFAAENELPADEMGARPRFAILVNCPDCGNVRRVRLKNATSPSWSGRCAACAANSRQAAQGPISKTHPEVAKRFSAASPVKPEDVTMGSSRKALFTCLSCSRDFESKVANQARATTQGRCAECLSTSEKAAA